MADDLTRRRTMVREQIEARGIHDARILEAFREVPRERFVPAQVREYAFDDGPLPIAEGQTISQPFIVAAMIDAAGIRPTDKVLEVGAGSGYAAAIMAQLAAQVFAIERHESLAMAARGRLAELGYRNVTVLMGDGGGGLPEQAPFDAILVAARGYTTPAELKEQLAPGGRLIIPVGGEDVQSLCKFTRTGPQEWASEELGQVRFVPLIRDGSNLSDSPVGSGPRPDS